jgi:flagellar hook assembly protein FlgD
MSSTVSGINATIPTASSTTSTGVTAGTLTQADFLKIMVAEFTQQDPLASGDSGGGSSGTSDYVNQLMSMTSLSTQETISSQSAQQLASSLPGETVDVTVNGTTYTGIEVQSARVDPSSGGVFFTVNGTELPIADLTSVGLSAAQTAAAAAAAAAASNSTTPASN